MVNQTDIVRTVIEPISTGKSIRYTRHPNRPFIDDLPRSTPNISQRMATATYPPLPPYYRLYKGYSENPNSAPEPPPPIEGTYVCFGGNYTVRFLLYIFPYHSLQFVIFVTYNVLPSLEEQGVPQLYPKDSNVLHILELADVLVETPFQYAKRIGEISSIFKNLHHLLNSLRPHHARATLIHIMELQILQRKQAMEDIKSRHEFISNFHFHRIA
ncbi:unnamed protein product [Thlaspi arvense]|uniref:Mediator of RNA polymerase II transcription subunit 7 n=1 Tax=Thlaspi arvense TaxID=13288 RepID=A0AAU9SHI8_THLAR|nr:unnamed protein product [Thlaspi arvense]